MSARVECAGQMDIWACLAETDDEMTETAIDDQQQ